MSRLPKTYLQHAYACLGVCRYCYEITTSAEACHAKLPDVILSLEVTIIMLRGGHDLAFERLYHCARVCAEGAEAWSESLHPRCVQSAAACRSFAAFFVGLDALA
ncbi:hypothetical protein [Neolewinella antarctica]|uniref:Uncharacterized protein n=1 Tax=Neolewinella antarctica TaxID=442734 RepID=A0ABX0XFQ6_9BACT|nr:hypothetical protein [Neolewinella antarctica]NJC28066.1 hypothetical protein [Neolewinella antarctica]